MVSNHEKTTQEKADGVIPKILQQTITGVALKLLLMIIVAVLVRNILASVSGYSGQGQPPMFGDYEAQRHWMEITTNLPTKEWYQQTPNNNLLYWGLDYPPLTAYFSYVFGQISSFIEPASMQLFTSQGYETPSHRVFMRTSVIICDLLVYFPAVFMFVGALSIHLKSQNRECEASHLLDTLTLLLLINPPLLLIDHGHFQYNAVSIGFTIGAVALLLSGRDWLGSIAFVCALNYKQMCLYYAPAFFVYLFFKNCSLKNFKQSVMSIGGVGVVTLLTFLLLWLPFVIDGQETTLQVVRRIFPIGRGLYEDKVANFWCSVSPFIKFKELFEKDKMAIICLGTTICGFLPSLSNLALHPTKDKFLFAVTNCAFSFFFFSFQVHEKSILLPLVPATLLICQAPQLLSVTTWINLIGVWSMYPLLEKDGVQIGVVASTLLLTSLFFLYCESRKLCGLFIISLSGVVVLAVLNGLVPPPARLPDLWHLLITTYSFAHFFLFWVWLNYLQWKLPPQQTKQKQE